MNRNELMRLAAKAAMWGSLAAIGFVTVSPIELRPQVAGLQTEHLAAFAVIGVLGGLAYPRRVLPMLLFLVTASACFEIAQNFTPGRHARLVDFAVKAVGAGLGLGLAELMRLPWRGDARRAV